MFLRTVLSLLILMAGSLECTVSTKQALLERTKYAKKDGYNNDDIYSSGEVSFLFKILKSDSPLIVFDVGANVGAWSNVAVIAAPQAQIYAFEPHPDVFKVLVKNTDPNHVKCFNVGFHNQKETAPLFSWGGDHQEELFTSQLNGIHFRPVLTDLLRKECSVVNVDLIALDEFCQDQQIDHIDLLKIDTEGNEWNVLQGAKKMIENQKIETIQFEYGGCYLDSQTTLKAVYEFLTSCGYSISRILPGGRLAAMTVWDDELENYQLCNCAAKIRR